MAASQSWAFDLRLARSQSPQTPLWAATLLAVPCAAPAGQSAQVRCPPAQLRYQEGDLRQADQPLLSPVTGGGGCQG